MNARKIGMRIRKLRGSESQQTLANKLQISKSALAMYERGERIPRDEVKVRIARYFGVSLESIFLRMMNTNSAEGRPQMRQRHERAKSPSPAPAPVQLPVFEYMGQLVADSRDVAPFLEKEHKHLLRDIRRYVRVMEKALSSKLSPAEKALSPVLDPVGKSIGPKLDPLDYFVEQSYIYPTGRQLPYFYCTEMGCELVAHKMKGDKGVIFTAQYVQAFHAMRDELAQRRELRAIGTPIQRSLTDALRDSGEVERIKGHAYGTYTNLAFKLVTGKTTGQHGGKPFSPD